MRGAAILCVTACASPTTPGAPAWTEISTGGVGGRWGQTAVLDVARDQMWMYGGGSSSGLIGDLVALHLDSLSWDTIDLSSMLSPRTNLASAIDVANDRLVLIDGNQGLSSAISEVVGVNLTTFEVTQLPQGPSARLDITAASDGAHAWIFGGASTFLDSLDDLWQFDFATNTWTELPESGAVPSGRTSYALEYWQGGLFLIGGHDTVSVKRDAWRYDLAAQAWTKLASVSSPTAWAHFGAALDPACDRIDLVGGDNLDNEDTALTTGFDLDDVTFSPLPTSTLPPARDHASLILDGKRDRLVLFGGGTLGDGLGTLDDAWVLDLEACP